MADSSESHHLIAFSGFTATNTSEGAREQAAQVLSKIDDHLEQAGVSKANLLTVTIYLSDILLRPQMDEAWNAWVDPDNPPVRTIVGVQLDGDAKVRMTAMAADAGYSLQGHSHGHGQGHSHTHIRRSSEAANAGHGGHGHSHGGHGHSHGGDGHGH